MPTGLAILADVGPVEHRGRLTGFTQVMWIAATLVTYGLGLAVSGLGLLGIRVLIAHLAVLAVLTIVVRLRLPDLHDTRSTDSAVAGGPACGRGLPAEHLVALVLVGAFYLTWHLAASTLGSYGAYFLVAVTQLDQRAATGLVLTAFLPAAGMALLFVRLADSPWRDRLFPIAAAVQVVAFGVGAATRGTMVAGMVVAVLLYSLCNVFGGEAIYKTWGQLLFAERVRATALGSTYAAARFVSAGFLLVVPVLIAERPAALLWLLTGFVTISGLLGLLIIRHQRGRVTGSSSPSRDGTDS